MSRNEKSAHAVNFGEFVYLKRLPVIPIPLKVGDPDGQLDLQTALNTAYDLAS